MQTETKFLLEIVFKDGGVSRKHYGTATAPALVMEEIALMEQVKSVSLRAVQVIDTKVMAGA
jgi:hypothetical protein